MLDDVVVANADGEAHLSISVRPAVNKSPSRAIVVYVMDMTNVVRLRDEIGRLVREHALELGQAPAAQEALEVTIEEMAASNHELQLVNDALADADPDDGRILKLAP